MRSDVTIQWPSSSRVECPTTKPTRCQLPPTARTRCHRRKYAAPFSRPIGWPVTAGVPIRLRALARAEDRAAPIRAVCTEWGVPPYERKETRLANGRCRRAAAWVATLRHTRRKKDGASKRHNRREAIRNRHAAICPHSPTSDTVLVASVPGGWPAFTAKNEPFFAPSPQRTATRRRKHAAPALARRQKPRPPISLAWPARPARSNCNLPIT
jgi:hypothetical protein